MTNKSNLSLVSNSKQKPKTSPKPISKTRGVLLHEILQYEVFIKSLLKDPTKHKLLWEIQPTLAGALKARKTSEFYIRSRCGGYNPLRGLEFHLSTLKFDFLVMSDDGYSDIRDEDLYQARVQQLLNLNPSLKQQFKGTDDSQYKFEIECLCDCQNSYNTCECEVDYDDWECQECDYHHDDCVCDDDDDDDKD